MKTFTIGLSLAALAFTGGAYAAPGQTPKGQVRISGDADGNGVVTRAEAQAQAATRFARLDVNKDGKLDAADRQAMREARRTRMFERLDTNKDGQISKAEFSAERAPAKRMAKGEPGKDGMHHGRRGHFRHGRGMMGKMADADKNGAVTQAEFATAALQRFDRLDANKDGQVTKEERAAARERMKAEWQQRRAQKAQG